MKDVDDIFEADHWYVNTGEETIHAKRISGHFRRLKWISSSIWLVFFLGPYLRWQGHQAILFDIPNREFHIFSLTLLPQDLWMLSLVLLFFGVLLGMMTLIFGRIFCGYFCFQTIWTDVYTLIEETLEGSPNKRYALDKAPWTLKKTVIKLVKHLLWLIIAFLTGFSFIAWFMDVFQLWQDVFTFNLNTIALITLGLFIAGTYFFAGFMREQVCFWLCPYARIQGAMVDDESILPTYLFKRGEPRGGIKKTKTHITDDKSPAYGDCVDCKQCVVVCPTGVDIRDGQQEGCITCGLCIDACDAVMEKLNRPKGLVRYISLKKLQEQKAPRLYQRPDIIILGSILLLCIFGVIYGINTITPIKVHVLHERQPLYVRLSNGDIQNKYVLKILNKTNEDKQIKINITGLDQFDLLGIDSEITLKNKEVTSITAFIRTPNSVFKEGQMPVVFHISSKDEVSAGGAYQTLLFGPSK